MIDWSSVETVFLDMDGTLLDLHFDNHFWLEHLPRRYAEHFNLCPEQAKERLIPMIMAERGSLNWYCTDYWSQRLALDITSLKAEIGDRIRYRPHVIRFLQALRASGLDPVIVTNCHPDPLELKLKHTGLDAHVAGIISSHQLGRAKEEPEFWTELQKQVRYLPATTLMVDDSQPVLETARQSGIGQCLAILAPDSQQPPRDRLADFPGIHHFDEVLQALDRRQPLPSTP